MPSIVDYKLYGEEPTWQMQFQNDMDRRCAIVKAFNWYNYMSDSKDHKKWLIDYLKSNKFDQQIIDNVGKIPNEQVDIQMGDIKGCIGFKTGTIARMLNMGAPLDDIDVQTLSKVIEFLNLKGMSIQQINSNKPSVQKYIDDAFVRIVEFFELKCDSVLQAQSLSTTEIQEYVKTIKPIYCKKIIEHYTPFYQEICTVVSGKDAELSEGYSCYKPIALNNLKNFIQDIISNCQSQIESTPKSYKVRKKRRKPPVELIKKLKYKKDEPSLGLVSVAASKIVDAQKLVVYNTKLRTISIYEADSSQGLSVKGTTITNYDQKKSKTKKLRKPKDFFAKVKDKGIRAFKSAFDSVKCVEKPAKGRINSDVILYGVYE
jgi:hypothetical protein